MVNVGDLISSYTLMNGVSPELLRIAVDFQKAETAALNATATLKKTETQAYSTGYQLTLLGRGATELGMLFTGLSVAIIGAGAAALKFGSEFETQMTRVVTLAGASREQVDGMRDEVLKLAGDTAVAPAELAKGLYVLMSTGMETKAAMESLRVAAEMTALGMGNMHDTTLAVTGAVFAYKSQNLTAADAANVLIKAVQLGNMEIQDLVPAISRVNPIAAALGVSFRDVAAGIATFTHAGVDSAVAATGMRAMLGNILTDSAKTEKGFTALSKALGDSSITMENFRQEMKDKGFTTAMVDLMNKVTDAGDKGVSAINKIFPNIRALTEALFVYKTNGGMVVDMLKDMNDGQDELAKGTAELHKTWAWQWEQMKVSITTLWISLSDSLLPMFKSVGAVLKEYLFPALKVIVDIFNSLPGPIQGAIVVFLGLTAAVGPILIFFGQLLMAVGNISRALPLLTAMLEGATAATEANTIATNANITVGRNALGQWTRLPSVVEAAGVSVSGIALVVTGFIALFVTAAYEAKLFFDELDKAAEDFKDRTHQATIQAAQDLLNQADNSLVLKNNIHDLALAQNILHVGVKEALATTKEAVDAADQEIRVTAARKKETLNLLDQVKALTSAQRNAIIEDKAKGLTNQEMIDIDNRLIGVTEKVIGVFERQTNSSIKSAKTASDEQTKAAAQIAKDITATQKLWDEYYQAVEVGQGDSLAVQRAGIDTWYNKQYAMIEKASVDTMKDGKRNVEAFNTVWEGKVALDGQYYERLRVNSGKYTTQEQSNISKITQAWEGFEKAAAKGDNDTLAVKLANIDKGYIKAATAVEAELKDNAGMYEALLPLTLTFFANKDAAITESTQKEQSQAKVTSAIWGEYYAVLSTLGASSTDNKIIQLTRQATIQQASLKEEIEKAKAAYDKKAIDYNDHLNALDALAIVKGKKIADDLQAAIEKVKFDTLISNLGILANAFDTMAAHSLDADGKMTSSFSKMASGMGFLIKTYQQGLQIVEQFSKAVANGDVGGQIAGIAAAGANVIASTDPNQHGAVASIAGGAISGMMTGAMIGSYVGPIGTAMGAVIGTVVGGAIGAIRQLFKDKTLDNIAKDAGTQWGTTFSKATMDAIKVDIKGGMSSQAAELMHMSDIIKDTGGVTVEMFSRLHDVFSMIETRQLSVGEGTKILNDNFAAFAAAGTSATGLISAGLQEIIRLDSEFGTNSKGISDYLAGQVVAAATGLNDMLGGMQAAATANAKNAAQLVIDDLTAKIAISSGATKTALEEQLKIAQELQKNIIGTFTVTESQGSGLAAAILADFAKMVDGGKTFREALDLLKPSIDSLTRALNTSGVDGGAAFSVLSEMSRIASDSVMGPLADAIGGANSALKGLHNSGILNQAMFTGIEQTAMQAYNSIIEQGGDGNAALMMMKPTLQTLWELQDKFGYTVDESTQALIDQGLEDGTLGEKHKSVSEQMLTATLLMTKALVGIARAMGVDIPLSADEMAAAVKDAALKAQKDLYDLEAAATGAAEGHSPTGIRQIIIRLNELPGVSNKTIHSVINDMMDLERSAAGALDPVAELLDKTLKQIKAFQEAPAVLRGATQAQKDFADSAHAAGVSNSDIAKILGTTTEAVDLYFKQLDEATAATKKFDDAQISAVKSLADLIASTKTADLSSAVTDAVSQLGKTGIDKSVIAAKDALTATQQKLSESALQRVIDNAAKTLRIVEKGSAEETAALETQAKAQEELDNLKTQHQITNTRDQYEAEIEKLGKIPAEYANTYVAADTAIRAAFADKQMILEASRLAEISALGPIPASYSQVYSDAITAVNGKYAILIQQSRNSTVAQIENLGPIPSAYEKTYKEAFDLVNQRYSALLIDLGAQPDLKPLSSWTSEYLASYRITFDEIARRHSDLMVTLGGTPSVPAIPSTPSVPAIPSIPSIPSGGLPGAFTGGVMNWSSSDVLYAASHQATNLLGNSEWAAAVNEAKRRNLAIPMAEGGDFLVTKPTLFMAGEVPGSSERVSFSGVTKAQMNGGNNEETVDALDRIEQQLSMLHSLLPGAVGRAVRDNVLTSGAR